MSDPVQTPDSSPPARPPLLTRRDLAKAGFECVLIVLSVVLALAVTGWADDRRMAARTAEMRGHLIAELRANRATLAGADILPHHQALKGAFAAAMVSPGARITRDQAEPAIRAAFRSGLHQAALKDVVWTSVSSSEVMEHLNPDEMFMLAEVYQAQGALRTLNGAGYDNALGLLDILSADADPTPRMMRMMLYFEDLIAQEQRLIVLYDAALKRMEADGAPAKG